MGKQACGHSSTYTDVVKSRFANACSCSRHGSGSKYKQSSRDAPGRTRPRNQCEGDDKRNTVDLDQHSRGDSTRSEGFKSYVDDVVKTADASTGVSDTDGTCSGGQGHEEGQGIITWTLTFACTVIVCRT